MACLSGQMHNVSSTPPRSRGVAARLAASSRSQNHTYPGLQGMVVIGPGRVGRHQLPLRHSARPNIPQGALECGPLCSHEVVLGKELAVEVLQYVGIEPLAEILVWVGHDLQSAWLLLLMCATRRNKYLLRTLPPSVTERFAVGHRAIERCLSELLAATGLSHLMASHCNEPGCLCEWAGWAWPWPLAVQPIGPHGPLAGGTSGAAGSLLFRSRILYPQRSSGCWQTISASELMTPRVSFCCLSSIGTTPSDKPWQKMARAAVDKCALEILFADLDTASRALLLSP